MRVRPGALVCRWCESWLTSEPIGLKDKHGLLRCPGPSPDGSHALSAEDDPRSEIERPEDE